MDMKELEPVFRANGNCFVALTSSADAQMLRYAESFCTNILYPHRKLLLYRSKEELPWLSALARYSV